MGQQLDEVRAWLLAGDEADYQAGVLLLQQHSKNRALLAHLLRKESAANREKLTYELVKVGCLGNLNEVSEVMNHFAQAVAGATCPVQQVAQVLTGGEFAAQPAPDDAHLPELVRRQLEELTQLMTKLFNQRCQLSNSLHDLDPKEGPRVVDEILTLQNQYNALAQKRRNLVEAGQPAAEATPAGQSGTALDKAPTFDRAVCEAAEALASAPSAPAAEASTAPDIERAALLQQRGNLRSRISKSRKSAAEAKTEAKRSEHTQKVGRLEVELQTVEMQLAQPA